MATPPDSSAARLYPPGQVPSNKPLVVLGITLAGLFVLTLMLILMIPVDDSKPVTPVVPSPSPAAPTPSTKGATGEPTDTIMDSAIDNGLIRELLQKAARDSETRVQAFHEVSGSRMLYEPPVGVQYHGVAIRNDDLSILISERLWDTGQREIEILNLGATHFKGSGQLYGIYTPGEYSEVLFWDIGGLNYEVNLFRQEGRLVDRVNTRARTVTGPILPFFTGLINHLMDNKFGTIQAQDSLFDPSVRADELLNLEKRRLERN